MNDSRNICVLFKFSILFSNERPSSSDQNVTKAMGKAACNG